MEQIKKSLVNLPFHSFMGQTEAQPVAKEPERPQETSNLEEKPVSAPAGSSNRVAKPQEISNHEEKPVSAPAASSNPADIIMLESDSDVENDGEEHVSLPAPSSISADVILLESDSDDEKPVNADPISANDQSEEGGENISGHVTENDNEDEPMSLSDLSSSFQKCFPSKNQTMKAQERKSALQLKPFDYAAAIKFGEEPIKKGEEGVRRSRLEKGSREKKSVLGQSPGTEEAGDFQLGRRRQAFPATGNRSMTFR